jgi:hypothetical protein
LLVAVEFHPRSSIWNDIFYIDLSGKCPIGPVRRASPIDPSPRPRCTSDSSSPRGPRGLRSSSPRNPS